MGIEATLLLIWSLVDVITVREVEIHQDAASPPYIEVVQSCYSRYLRTWLTVVYTEVGILMFVVAVLAFKTRKIRRKHFKDTKKVNMYLFMTILVTFAMIPSWLTVRTNTVNDPVLNLVIINLGVTGYAILCQLLLFAPKVMPPLIRQLFHKTAIKRAMSEFHLLQR